MRRATKARAFWSVLFLVVFTDCTTKQLVETALDARDEPRAVVGQIVRLNLGYNEGAAFGMSFGRHTQLVLALIGVAALGFLFTAYRRLEARVQWRAVGLALIAGGAAGNLWDRIWSPRGVVDFIDIGVGSLRFWTFNVADIGITCGAVILLLIWGSPRRERPERV